MIVAKHVTDILYPEQFDNFDWTTAFYWSYTLLLKPPTILVCSWLGSCTNKLTLSHFSPPFLEANEQQLNFATQVSTVQTASLNLLGKTRKFHTSKLNTHSIIKFHIVFWEFMAGMASNQHISDKIFLENKTKFHSFKGITHTHSIVNRYGKII